MSLLIPTNLSNAHKGKRKPDKNSIMFACDYPTSIRQDEDVEREPPDTGDQQKTDHNATEFDELSRKRSPVPVTLVDLDPAQMEPDEYGAELGKEARVWKVYVQETDKWDRELVDGWNKSLDVILVFAALFSAVSTAFLIESSAMLQQDPNDVSATVLLAISQTLLVIANGSSVDMPTSSSSPDPASSFSPSQYAVIVNTLWYLSLSLSIATSLLAMLAKDWCHSFTSNRTGHPWDQALRRQRKWAMIERWKMQELIMVLPSLIHLSLLLFSIGLCAYVWDMNKTAAIPVVCVAGASFGFYLWCSSMASVVALFPYTTIISRVMQSEFMDPIPAAVLVLVAVAMGLVCLPLLLVEFVASGGKVLYHAIRDSFACAQEYIRVARLCMVKDNQDETISLALQWLIQNCETPSSVAIALQAIAGASSRIPIEPLISCQATLQIFRRLVSSSPGSQTKADTELYTRALSFLESGIKLDRGQDILVIQPVEDDPEIESSKQTEGIEVILWDLKAEHERQVVELINSTQILPTKQNIEALSIGGTATSLGLRLLNGDTKPGCDAFDSIITKLYDPSQRLDPAAQQSLVNAAIFLTLCSKSSLFPSGMVQERVKLYASSLRTGRNSNPAPTPQDLQTTNVLATRTVFILPDDQQQQCQRLMSKSSFPKLDKYLNCAIGESIADRNILRALWNIYERSTSALASASHAQRFAVFQQRRDKHTRALFKARTQQLIATQFWLLLCLIGDASTDLQKDLKMKIERSTELGLEINGVDSVKAELEEEIIQGYERGHRFGLYSARIIECILQARGTQLDDDFFRRITQDLKEVPSNIRGLSSFLHQPVTPQSDPPQEHPPLGSSRASIPTASDVHTVNRSDERIQSAETDSPLVLHSTHDPNTEPPPLSVPISILPDAETDGATTESTVDHVAIPMLPGTTEPSKP
ncbi:Vascular endothelial growth factor receptor 2 [Rhizoctonia solani]|uniref:Vascular endothelial growth factor receptor 2 n=1 Tax=Rhizoctonia solani TaxID=456999 RepID=A0A0K6FXS1_9AGAM|nr:Vascular endothelial growth factor receptor 2 [Rhizoctonia solani]